MGRGGLDSTVLISTCVSFTSPNVPSPILFNPIHTTAESQRPSPRSRYLLFRRASINSNGRISRLHNHKDGGNKRGRTYHPAQRKHDEQQQRHLVRLTCTRAPLLNTPHTPKNLISLTKLLNHTAHLPQSPRRNHHQSVPDGSQERHGIQPLSMHDVECRDHPLDSGEVDRGGEP